MAENTLTPEERQKIYEEEKTRIETREKIEKEKGERNRPAQPIKGNPVVALIVIGLIVFFVVIRAINLSKPSSSPTGSAVPMPPTNLSSEENGTIKKIKGAKEPENPSNIELPEYKIIKEKITDVPLI
ncbi:MAG: hypothetical protein Q7I94_03205 [Candidatus Contubernalis sp.]|nr:hypothetical protein [Candidatus Contubernalis sp.]